jgi:copper transport protein
MSARHAGLAVAAVLLAALAVLGLGGPAQAHNELVKATPADGSTWKHLPRQGTLTFEEEVLPGELKVWAGDTALPVTSVPGKPSTMTVDLADVEPAKTVVLTWSVIDSHDGHRSGGALRLHVTGATPPPAAASADDAPDESEPGGLGTLSYVSRVVGYVAMALLVGGLLFLSLLWPAGATDRRARVLLATSVVAGVLAAVGSAAVVLWRASDLDVGDALATDYGRAASSMVLLWLLAAVVVAAVLQLDESAVQGVAWRVGAVVVAGGIIRVAGINAHATQGNDRILGIVADFLHLTAMSAWVGGLVMLSVCLLPSGRLNELEQVVPKFSRVALVSVLMIVASGLLLLWDISRGIDGFWTTHYARVLVVKLGIFSLVMLAAMKSKRWVQTTLADAVATHRRTAVRSFAVSVAAETVLVLAVLAAASVLVTSSPGV